ncbi:MAG: GGDEF domain-containing protein [Acidiferrobacterales bacterium]
MKQLLSLTIMIEPDRCRLARFAVDAVQATGGNVFAAAVSLDPILDSLRRTETNSTEPLHVEIEVDDDRLILAWNGHRELLSQLPARLSDAELNGLSERFRRVGESTDPELLRRRNQAIGAELERAKARAAAEMASLEAALDRKKAELQESMRVAETDGLTGLLNRGAYDARLREAIARSQRQHEKLCLILLDLDNFKEINDTHGHQFGDKFLKRMADAMRASVRENVDLPCRTGGDEFAIILFADMTIARRSAQRILEKMEGRTSIGITSLQNQDSATSLVARADAALYEAKHQGRGRYMDDDSMEPHTMREQA